MGGEVKWRERFATLTEFDLKGIAGGVVEWGGIWCIVRGELWTERSSDWETERGTTCGTTCGTAHGTECGTSCCTECSRV